MVVTAVRVRAELVAAVVEVIIHLTVGANDFCWN